MKFPDRETQPSMKTSRRAFTGGTIAAGIAAASGVSMVLPANAQSLAPEEAKQIAEDAYVYGYSLITSEVTRVQMSNVPKAKGLTAPMGQFINVPRYPPADYRGVSAPNADTLYSVSWVDLSEPIVFSHPDMGKRFYLFEMTDLWMHDFETPGARTAGGKAANYLLTGPGWTGKVPAGMKQIKSATRYMVILGRTFADGSEADYNDVNALQAQLKLTPLSSWGKSYTYAAPPVNPNPGFSMTDKPQAVINAMDTSTYFNMMAKLMCKDAPPSAEDGPMLAKMARIGIVPCKAFDISQPGPGRSGGDRGRREGRFRAHRSQPEEHGADGKRVDSHYRPWQLRHGLHEAGGRGRFWLAGKPPGGCGLSVHVCRR